VSDNEVTRIISYMTSGNTDKYFAVSFGLKI